MTFDPEQDLEPDSASARERRLKAYIETGVWWAPSVNRFRDQTGIAHAVWSGGALCGARAFSCGGSFRSAKAAGAQECQRCRVIIDKMKKRAP